MAYLNGKIRIPNVTGNIVISVQTASAVINAFDKNDPNIVDKARINSSGTTTAVDNKQLVTGFIRCTKGKTVSVETDAANNANTYTGMIAFYGADKSYLGKQLYKTNAAWSWSADYKSGSFDTSASADVPSDTAYIKLCLCYDAPYLTSDNIVIKIS